MDFLRARAPNLALHCELFTLSLAQPCLPGSHHTAPSRQRGRKDAGQGAAAPRHDGPQEGPGLRAQGERWDSRLLGLSRGHERRLGPAFPSQTTHFGGWGTEAAGVLGGAVPPKATSIGP